jgi:hypothetical protein
MVIDDLILCSLQGFFTPYSFSRMSPEHWHHRDSIPSEVVKRPGDDYFPRLTAEPKYLDVSDHIYNTHSLFLSFRQWLWFFEMIPNPAAG